jgi:hypothetical protein
MSSASCFGLPPAPVTPQLQLSGVDKIALCPGAQTGGARGNDGDAGLGAASMAIVCAQRRGVAHAARTAKPIMVRPATPRNGAA